MNVAAWFESMKNVLGWVNSNADGLGLPIALLALVIANHERRGRINDHVMAATRLEIDTRELIMTLTDRPAQLRQQGQSYAAVVGSLNSGRARLYEKEAEHFETVIRTAKAELDGFPVFPPRWRKRSAAEKRLARLLPLNRRLMSVRSELDEKTRYFEQRLSDYRTSQLGR